MCHFSVSLNKEMILHFQHYFLKVLPIDFRCTCYAFFLFALESYLFILDTLSFAKNTFLVPRIMLSAPPVLFASSIRFSSDMKIFSTLCLLGRFPPLIKSNQVDDCFKTSLMPHTSNNTLIILSSDMVGKLPPCHNIMTVFIVPAAKFCFKVFLYSTMVSSLLQIKEYFLVGAETNQQGRSRHWFYSVCVRILLGVTANPSFPLPLILSARSLRAMLCSNISINLPLPS